MPRSKFAPLLLAAAGTGQALGNVIVVPKHAPAEEPRGLMLYDCQADFTDSMRSWSEGKRTWCCNRHGVSCSKALERQSDQAVTSADFDCEDARAAWEAEWSDGKKAWCCHNAGVGCTAQLRTLLQPTADQAPVPLAPAPRDCDADLRDWARAWSDDKKAWCCKRWGHGCGSPILSEDLAFVVYNCQADAARWETDWSDAKRAYCCGPQNRSCPPSAASRRPAEVELAAPPAPPAGQEEGPGQGMFDCKADLYDWVRAWAAPKMAWCCKNLGQGCRSDAKGFIPPSQVSDQQPFDCGAAILNWRSEWSTQKQDWCCKYQALGCLPVAV